MFRVRTPRYVARLFAGLLALALHATALADQNAGWVAVGTTPVDVAVSPDGTRAYSSNQGSNNVSVINLFTNTVIATIPVGGGGLQNLAVSPDNSKVYVASSSSNTVRVINTATLTEVGNITLGGATFPVDVAFDPYGSGRAFVTCLGTNQVAAIDVATNTLSQLFNSGNPGPRGVAVVNTPNGVRVYTANASFGSNFVEVLTPFGGFQQGIAFGANTQPWYLAATADGSKVFVSLNGTVQTARIDTSSNTINSYVTNFGGQPWGVATAQTPFGEKVYVADRAGWDGINGDVTIIQVSNNARSGLGLGRFPMGVASKPDGTRVYVATSGRNRVSIIDTTQ